MQVAETLRNQPTLVEFDPPAIVAGDVHGQFTDLQRILIGERLPDKTKRWLFLGDYVVRFALFRFDSLLVYDTTVIF